MNPGSRNICSIFRLLFTLSLLRIKCLVSSRWNYHIASLGCQGRNEAIIW